MAVAILLLAGGLVGLLVAQHAAHSQGPVTPVAATVTPTAATVTPGGSCTSLDPQTGTCK